MATIIREEIMNGDDTLNVERIKQLRYAVKDIKCEFKTKSGKTCGRPYTIHIFGRCGCQFHEDYSHALKAISMIQKL
jgi:hypothetical protein